MVRGGESTGYTHIHTHRLRPKGQIPFVTTQITKKGLTGLNIRHDGECDRTHSERVEKDTLNAPDCGFAGVHSQLGNAEYASGQRKNTIPPLAIFSPHRSFFIAIH